MTPEQFMELENLRRIDEIEAKLKAHKNAEEGHTFGGYAKAVGSGAVEGVAASTAGLPGDIETLGRLVGGKVKEKIPMPAWLEPYRDARDLVGVRKSILPTTEDITSAVGADYEPKNKSEEWAKSISSGVSGAVATPLKAMSWPVRALIGAMSGGGGQAGKELGGGEAGGVAGSIAPWLASTLFTGRTPNVVKSTKDMVKSVGAEEIKAAAERARGYEKTLGERFILSQAFPEENKLTGLTRALAAEPGGHELGEIVGRQGGSARTLTNDWIENMSRQDMGPKGEKLTQRGGRKVMNEKTFGPNPEETDELRAVFGEPKYKKVGGQIVQQPEFGSWPAMIAGLNENTPKGISNLARQMMPIDKKALPAIIKKEAQGVANDTQSNANWMLSMTDKLFGREAELPLRKQFTEKMKTVAGAQGKTPAVAREYAQKSAELMEAVQAASRDRSIMSRINETNFLQETGRNWPSEGMRSANLVAPLWRTGSAIERAVSKDTIDKLTRALSTPGGEQMLLDIAKFGGLEHKAKTLVMSLIASRGGSAGAAGKNPDAVGEYGGQEPPPIY